MNRQLLIGALCAGLFISTTASAECDGNVPRTLRGHFTDNGDGTVSDVMTGLMWKTCSEGQSYEGGSCTGSPVRFDWQGALQRADGASSAGHSDWRLPNVKELASITDLGCFQPATDEEVFPGTRSDTYWASTPYAGNGAHAWWVNFTTASDGWGPKTDTRYVRLVRAGAQ